MRPLSLELEPTTTTQTWRMVLESVLLTVLVIGLGWWFSPADPLLLNGQFPWPMLAPVLIGLRYGFVFSLTSAIALSAVAVLWCQSQQLEVPGQYVVGILLLSMLCGEFRDRWQRQIELLSAANRYRQFRLDEFTRSWQALRLSHDNLEQRIAGSGQSLRSALQGIRSQLRQAPGTPEQRLLYLANSFLQLISQYGSLRVASIFAVSEGQVDPRALANTGSPFVLTADDVLVREALRGGELVSIRHELSTEDAELSEYQVCIPLVDTHGKIWGLLVVKQMAFFALHERTLRLMSLLGGYLADWLTVPLEALKKATFDTQAFTMQVQRCIRDWEDNQLSASLVAFEFLGEKADAQLALLRLSQRGLDLQWHGRSREGNPLVLVLLPLTDQKGVQGYFKRVNALFSERLGVGDWAQWDIGVKEFTLDKTHDAQGLNHFIGETCALRDQPTVI